VFRARRAFYRQEGAGGERRLKGDPMSALPVDQRFVAWLHWAMTGVGGETTFLLSRWLFLRMLGIVCLIAFASFWVQVTGLIGSNGILPVRDFLRALESYLGPSRYWRLPTLFWLNSSDLALHLVCGLGVLFSLLLMLGVAPVVDLVVIWALYLSLVVAGQDFMSFQWDVLLIETCLLAVFLAPAGVWPRLATEQAVSPLGLLLLWWLLFRLMFESGAVKLSCGDPTWRQLTALNYHYFTQPLPTWVGWYANALPAWFQRASVAFIYVVEIGLPFLIFFSPPFRYIACGGTIVLMLLIAITGNYNFFNLLTICLALLLLDDRVWVRIMPDRLLHWIAYAPGSHDAASWPVTAIALAAALLYFVIGGAQVLRACTPRVGALSRAESRLSMLPSFRSLNSYGLFRVMTRRRPEIVVEGSADGEHWTEYRFKYKPGDLQRRPAFVAPHQPRLDWQMWFAALGSYETVPWFQSFLAGLLQGRPQVLRLLADNPFPARPPRFVRASLYEYRFTTPQERRRLGAWWARTYIAPYSPVLSLRDPREPQSGPR
jgi:lipase maturation factor 1